MKTYLSNIYKVLFEPYEAFETLRETTVMPVAVITLLVSHYFLFASKISFSSGHFSSFVSIISLFLFFAAAIIFWFSSALFFEFTAKIYGKAGKLRTLLTLSAFSTLPYIFLAPFELIKKYSDIGYFFGTKLQVLLLFWIIFLYGLSLKKTYDLTNASAFMLIILPGVAYIFGFIWLIGTFINLGYIYTV